MRDLTRRKFLTAVAVTGGGLLIGGEILRYFGLGQGRMLAQSPNLTPQAYLAFLANSEPSPTPTPTHTPTATPTSPGAKPKVVHAHSASATNWDFGSDWYGNHVDQNAVN